MAAALVIVFLASFVRTLAGFGYALVASPFLLLVLEPKSVVVINNILGMVLHAVVLFNTRRFVDLRRAALICAGTVVGIPVGTYILASVNPVVLKLLMAALITPFSILLLLGHSHHFKRDTIGCGITGLLSGVLTTSTSMGGPPIVLFLLNQGLAKEQFVGTLAATGLFTTLLGIGAFATVNLVTPELLRDIAILLPVLFLGSYLGIRLLPKIDRNLFRRIIAAIVSVFALVIVVTSLIELI